MEDILIGIINFFAGIIDSVTCVIKPKKVLLISFVILIICLIIVYILTKDF